METIKIDILNPKARKLLNDLADLDLIAIRQTSENDFSDVVKRIRKKAGVGLTESEIAKEVESVRYERTSKDASDS
jgi:hypothetical protein